jgi:hypothetical protein
LAGLQGINDLKKLFAPLGVKTIYIKLLAKQQDNDKNQIYLGSGLDGVANLFPASIGTRSASQSTAKRESAKGRPKLEAALDFAWLDAQGKEHLAPNTRIIDYFQYPEVRLSGFLKGCDHPPDSLRRTKQAQYGRRILALGVRSTGRVVGYVLTEQTDDLANNFPVLPELPGARVLRVLPIGGSVGSTPFDLLRAELHVIVKGGWHPSVILRPGAASPQAFKGAQGAGFTLEALLGVSANAKQSPDKHGYEIKAHGGSRISLMTPSPDGGYQGSHTFREFMDKFGSDAKKGDGSRRFTGMYRSGFPNQTNGMVLVVEGYDATEDKFQDPAAVAVELRLPETGVVVASWSLARLANAWNNKHASALYVTYESRPSAIAAHGSDYRYHEKIVVGEGTDVWRLLRAIHRGLVFYDPAHSIYADGKAKVRPQWRVNTKQLVLAARVLYAEVRSIDL